MWRELIQGLSTACEFSDPVTLVQLRKVEQDLGVSLPSDLHDLMCESNGVFGEYGAGLIWSLERIIKDNLSFRRNAVFRELYMPFDHLLFFADAGNGDQFAFAIKGGLVCQDNVYAWDHEDDARHCVAPSLKRYLEDWLTGKIQL
jgi:hypothetical protein